MKFGLSCRRAKEGGGAIQVEHRNRPDRRYRVLMTFLFFACDMVAQIMEKKIPAWEATQWTRIEAAAGRMNLDGTLRLSFPLGSSIALKQLGVRLELEHRIQTDAMGRPCSEWDIRGLQSSLAPKERTHLRWQPLTGANVNFERAKISRRLANAGDKQWSIRELGPVEFEIRSLDGRAWRYRQGVLVGAEHPTLGRLRFATQGAWISKIEQVDTAIGETPLLQATYTDAGRLLSLKIYDEKPQQLTWTADGHLDCLRRGDGTEVRLRYEHKVVTEIFETGKEMQFFTWRENPGHDRGNSPWPAPVHLASDSENDYTYELTVKGFVMRRRELANGSVTTTVFNPRRRQLNQRSKRGNFVVLFRKQPDDGVLEYIELDGNIVEQYIYDVHGRLVGIRRPGETDLTLNYDETGRLMGLKEAGLP